MGGDSIAEDQCGFDAQGLVDLFEKFHLIGRDHAIGLCKRRHECGERLFGGVFERFEFLFQARKRHGNQCEPLEMGSAGVPDCEAIGDSSVRFRDAGAKLLAR